MSSVRLDVRVKTGRIGEMCERACGMLLKVIENRPVENAVSAPFLVTRQS